MPPKRESKQGEKGDEPDPKSQNTEQTPSPPPPPTSPESDRSGASSSSVSNSPPRRPLNIGLPSREEIVQFRREGIYADSVRHPNYDERYGLRAYNHLSQSPPRHVDFDGLNFSPSPERPLQRLPRPTDEERAQLMRERMRIVKALKAARKRRQREDESVDWFGPAGRHIWGSDTNEVVLVIPSSEYRHPYSCYLTVEEIEEVIRGIHIPDGPPEFIEEWERPTDHRRQRWDDDDDDDGGGGGPAVYRSPDDDERAPREMLELHSRFLTFCGEPMGDVVPEGIDLWTYRSKVRREVTTNPVNRPQRQVAPPFMTLRDIHEFLTLEPPRRSLQNFVDAHRDEWRLRHTLDNFAEYTSYLSLGTDSNQHLFGEVYDAAINSGDETVGHGSTSPPPLLSRSSSSSGDNMSLGGDDDSGRIDDSDTSSHGSVRTGGGKKKKPATKRKVRRAASSKRTSASRRRRAATTKSKRVRKASTQRRRRTTRRN